MLVYFFISNKLCIGCPTLSPSKRETEGALENINFVETKNVTSFRNNHFKNVVEITMNVGYASEERKSYMEKKDKRRFELSKYYFNFSI